MCSCPTAIPAPEHSSWREEAKGRYFGPYPSAGAIRESLSLLQRPFRCASARTASTPTAPGLPAVPDQALQGALCRLVEPGVRRGRAPLGDVPGRAQPATGQRAQRRDGKGGHGPDFEKAAELRDQIALLRRVQDQQYMEGGTAMST
jgi:excinuclease ABC subunit C